MKRLFAVMLLVALLLSAGSAVFAAPQKTPETAAQTAAQYLLENVPSPGVDHAAVVIALARGGYEVPAGYFSTYYNALAARVQQSRGVLSHTRYQDYSEAILALTAIGRDPRSVCGYDLTVPLGNYLETAKGGLRGVAFALLALDCGAYEIPADPSADVAATRELYVNFILNRQLSDGGWSFSGDASTAQATALALQALSAYEKRAGVRGAVMLGIDCLAALQGYDGGYGSAQADAEALLALAALGIPATDTRFLKNASGIPDSLVGYCLPNGGFRHIEQADLPTTALALQALVATAHGNLFNMGVPAKQSGEMDPGVCPSERTAPETTFQDVARHPNRAAIEELASYEIINGMGDGKFEPDATMNRAQFAKIVVCSLGLTAEYRGTFLDVPEEAWYAGYVDTAAAYGIVNGIGNGNFDPEGLITRQAAAAMVVRAAQLCGLDTSLSASEITQTLASYPDGSLVSSYARQPFAYCCRTAILSGSELEPLRPILRCEIAQMLYNLLLQTPLLK